MIDIQEKHQLGTLGHLCIPSSITAGHPTDSNNGKSFYICQIQSQNQQAIANSNNARKRLHYDAPVTNQAHPKRLTHLQCSSDTVADINVMPARVFKHMSCYYSRTNLRPAEGNLKVYDSTGMYVFNSFVIYYHIHNKAVQGQSFNVTDIEGNTLISCADTCN